MSGLSPWAASARNIFSDNELKEQYAKVNGGISFTLHNTSDALWLSAKWDTGTKLLFRLAFAPNGGVEIKEQSEHDNGVDVTLGSIIGDFIINIAWPKHNVLHYTTSLVPVNDLFIPFWPKDIVVPDVQVEGEIKVQQFGSRSGLLYFNLKKPETGTILYLQNLTALNDYCEQTKTSAADTVNGQWPEFGFSLPAAVEKPLAAGKKVTLSDATVIFDNQVAIDEPAMTRQFLDMLADAYLQLPLPETNYHNWLEIIEKGLNDISNNSGCWSQVKGNEYLNAYVCDYYTPPEIMVQLAVMLPVLDYQEWSGNKIEMCETLRRGLPEFYNPKMGTIMRWLPAAEKKLTGEEEHKKPNVMDSWYLHHPLLNLARLANRGDDGAKKLLLDSLPYAIKVARHFNYRWPVFYNMETLEVIKAETQPGKGGEKDVAGIYIHVLLQAFEITGDKQYVEEAEAAAATLKGLGFDLFYQANNTAFGAKGLLKLYLLTGKQEYLDISYLLLANIFRNVRLWDCNYGHGKYFPSFFTLFPLNDAPYTAVYEEEELFSAFHEFLRLAQDVELLPSVLLLTAEYIRNLVFRGAYYYPPMLPQKILVDEPKTGELDPNLWIALEDLHDGWEQNGEVGQEVYGTGNAFGIVPRHYHKVQGEDFLLFIDYPINEFLIKEGSLSFRTGGDSRLECRMVLVGTKSTENFTVKLNNNKVYSQHLDKDNLAYTLKGNSQISVNWKVKI